MPILNFLFDNIVLVIIVFAVLSSIVTKLKQQDSPNGERRTAGPMMPSFGERPDAASPRRMAPNVRELQRSPAPQEVRRAEERRAERQEVWREARRAEELEERRMLFPDGAPSEEAKQQERHRRSLEGIAVSAGDIDTTERAERTRALTSQPPLERDDTHFPQFSARDALKGMIWAEILGPPRAKRSHRSSRR